MTLTTPRSAVVQAADKLLPPAAAVWIMRDNITNITIMNMYNVYVFYHTTIKIATELRNVGGADYALSHDKALYKSTNTLLYFTIRRRAVHVTSEISRLSSVQNLAAGISGTLQQRRRNCLADRCMSDHYPASHKSFRAFTRRRHSPNGRRRFLCSN